MPADNVCERESYEPNGGKQICQMRLMSRSKCVLLWLVGKYFAPTFIGKVRDPRNKHYY